MAIGLYFNVISGQILQNYNINPNAPLRLSPDNVLGVIDTFDVPLKVEKLGIQASAIKAANSTKNIIFINHVK